MRGNVWLLIPSLLLFDSANYVVDKLVVANALAAW